MLYGPLHGAKISKTNQYIATIIRKGANELGLLVLVSNELVFFKQCV